MAAIVVGPVYLHAGGGGRGLELIAARHESNQQVIEHLAALITGSAEVVAVHRRLSVGSFGGSSAGRWAEVVLLLDPVEGEHVRPAQIAVLSHSAVLHTITLHALDGSGLRSLDYEPTADSRQATSFGLFTREHLASADFGERWRTDPRVVPRVVAVGISDMTVEVVQPARASNSAAAGPIRLRLSLRWSADSVDGEDEASVLLSARLGLPGALE